MWILPNKRTAALAAYWQLGARQVRAEPSFLRIIVRNRGVPRFFWPMRAERPRAERRFWVGLILSKKR